MDITRPLTLDIVREELAENGYCIGRPDPDAYHEWKKLLPGAISYSMLKDFARSPYAFRFELDQEKTITPAMRRGSLVDCLALTPELFTTRYRVEPKTTIAADVRELADILAAHPDTLPENVRIEPYRVRLKKNGLPYANDEQDPIQKEAWERLRADGIRIYAVETAQEARRLLQLKRENITRITPAEESEARAIATATRAALEHHFPQGYTTQVAMYLRITHFPDGSKAPTPLTICALVDVWPTRTEESPAALGDLKLTEANLHVDRKLVWNIHDMGYTIQAGIESILHQTIFGEPLDMFSFLCMSPKAPYEDKVVDLDRDALDTCEDYTINLLKNYAAALALGNFGTPHLGRVNYSSVIATTTDSL